MNVLKMRGTIATAFVILVFTNRTLAQVAAAPNTPTASIPWRSDKVIYVAGLADVKPNSAGSLSLTTNTVVFANKDVDGSIPFDRITAVSVGDERVATGGTSAKVARMVPFFGFGAAMGALTNKTVDLLSVEYMDKNGGYHGAVFEIPKAQAVLAQEQLESLTAASSVVPPKPCAGPATPNTILVAPITPSEIDLPAEYRVLIYEQLVEALRVSVGTGTVYRAGDASAACTAKKLKLSVTAFKKGNEAVRASTGPVGLFVGGTSVTFHLSLVDNSGTVVFETSLKTNKRGDGDSLSVTRDLAKSVSKRLAKAKRTGVQAAS